MALLVVPRESSIFCAAGMLMCDFQHDDVRALKRPLADVGAEELTALLGALADAGRATLHGEGVADAAISFKAALDLRYVGQWHELQVPLDWELGRRPGDRRHGGPLPRRARPDLRVRVVVLGDRVPRRARRRRSARRRSRR